MKGRKYIIYIFIPVLAGLFFLLGWNCVNMYRYERAQIKVNVESAISDAAFKIQWYNGSLLNNYALMLTDKDYDSKLAFAAGLTRNKSKIGVYFNDEETIPKSPGADTNIINKEYLQKKNIKYKPDAVMVIGQFDSLFKIELSKNKIRVPYRILRSRHTDTAETKDIFVSAPFIIDFFAPKMYSIHYGVPMLLIVRNMLPYLLSNALLCLLLVAGFIFYYRSYQLQLQLSAFKESLLGNITHELKTPLTSLQLIVDDAKKNISDSTIVAVPFRHIQFAENELKRMKLIVDKILSFSKMSREQFIFNKERVELDKVISDSIVVMEMNTQQVKGTISYKPGNQVTVLGDPVLMVNAVSALLDNALKYTNQPPEIHISLAMETQFAVISVRDNGIGIPQEMGKKIFEPFFRIPTGNVYNTSGHGLGLSFVQQVMKLHGGGVNFADNGNGTIFYLKFKIS